MTQEGGLRSYHTETSRSWMDFILSAVKITLRWLGVRKKNHCSGLGERRQWLSPMVSLHPRKAKTLKTAYRALHNLTHSIFGLIVQQSPFCSLYPTPLASVLFPEQATHPVSRSLHLKLPLPAMLPINTQYLHGLLFLTSVSV